MQSACALSLADTSEFKAAVVPVPKNHTEKIRLDLARKSRFKAYFL